MIKVRPKYCAETVGFPLPADGSGGGVEVPVPVLSGKKRNNALTGSQSGVEPETPCAFRCLML